MKSRFKVFTLNSSCGDLLKRRHRCIGNGNLTSNKLGFTIYNCTKPPQSQERYEEMTNKAKCQKLPPQSQVAYRNREEL